MIFLFDRFITHVGDIFQTRDFRTWIHRFRMAAKHDALNLTFKSNDYDQILFISMSPDFIAFTAGIGANRIYT